MKGKLAISYFSFLSIKLLVQTLYILSARTVQFLRFLRLWKINIGIFREILAKIFSQIQNARFSKYLKLSRVKILKTGHPEFIYDGKAISEADRQMKSDTVSQKKTGCLLRKPVECKCVEIYWQKGQEKRICKLNVFTCEWLRPHAVRKEAC